MHPELLSATRPSAIRLWSFLGLTIGGALLSLGAVLPWASIPPFDATATHGIDVWEGWVALIAGLTALIGMLVMRVAASGDVRRGIAVCVLVLAVAAAFLAALDATALADRFSGSEQRSRLAREIARETGEPYDEVRRLLERTHDLEFPVQTQAGIWIAVLGGLVAAGGAVASLAWARSAEGRSLTATPGPDTSSGSPRPQP